MALIPGTRLGPYEVAAPLGVGGMGEVYRATDTKLKRQVALKISLAGLTTRPLNSLSRARATGARSPRWQAARQAAA